MLSKIGSWFAIREDEEEIDEVDETGASAAAEPAPRRKVVPLTEAAARRAGNGSVAVFVPRSFADVTEIADALRSREVVIVNLQGAERGLLQRVVDFTSGVAYTLDGRIQKLAEAIYLVVPAGVAVNAAGVRDHLGGDGLLDLSDRPLRP